MSILRFDTKGRVLGPTGWAMDRLGSRKDRRKFGKCQTCASREVEVYWGVRLRPEGDGVFREEFRVEVLCWRCLAHHTDRN